MSNYRERHQARQDFADKNIHPKLRRSLRLYLIIAVIVFIFVLVSAFRAHASGFVVALGFAAGIAAGIVFSRIYKISWDKDAAKAINKTDLYGGVLLILYIAFDLSRDHLVKIFTQGPAVGATSLALLAGALFGRVLGTGWVIIDVVRSEKVLRK
jgi:predicted neutral ceramidase superfamily lipid hydrolase